ncbi:hypothetical protein [Erythrobacter colymbi]|uniref:hypothetical protein n=1 Tax=Erythrobacter colymbi TaxID=1161202 RepID=UPI000A3B5B41|nr:hypothetical protein [Erythrobacter colymbi]
MKEKVALYSLGIGIFATGGAIFNHLVHGKPIRLELLFFTPLIALVFGYLLWLRWDWAPEEGRKACAERRRERGKE